MSDEQLQELEELKQYVLHELIASNVSKFAQTSPAEAYAAGFFAAFEASNVSPGQMLEGVRELNEAVAEEMLAEEARQRRAEEDPFRSIHGTNAYEAVRSSLGGLNPAIAEHLASRAAAAVEQAWVEQERAAGTYDEPHPSPDFPRSEDI